MKIHNSDTIRFRHGPETSLFTASILFLAPMLAGAPGSSWTQETFEDFSRGRLGNVGNNIYVTREGRVETIQRWDLNQDGFLDVIFNSTHDSMHWIPPTLAEVNSKGEVSSRELSVLGSKAAVVGDFNKDGFSDLVFMPNRQNVQGHQRYYLTMIYGGPDGWPASRAQRPLPLYNPSAIEQADLNADGWPDLVVAENFSRKPGHRDGHFLSVYWGSEDGFKVDSLSQFEIENPIGMVRGQFDGMGGVDVAILAGNSTLYTLYATKDAKQNKDWKPISFSLSEGRGEKENDLNLQAVAAEDIDGDGILDLVSGSSDPLLYILHGNSGKDWGALESIEAFPATQVTAGDIDGDGAPDLVLTDLKLGQAMGGEAAGARPDSVSSVRVLWAGSGGYATDRLLELNISSAIHSAIGDFNGDGRPDLAIAVHQGTTTTEADSLLYFGASERRLQQASVGIPTSGATQAVVIPGTKDKFDKIVFTNSLFNTLGEAVPILLYWGSSEGFSPENRSEFPNRSGYESSAADLNHDGQVDLLFVNSGHAGPAFSKSDPELGAHIYWGAKSGTTPGPNKFDVSRRTILNEINLGGTNIADLNRDGYLDLILGAFEGPVPGTHLVVYYGSKEGFSAAAREAIPVTGRCISPLAADLNGDNWLDLTVVAYDADTLWTFYGGPEGFSEENRSSLYFASPIDIDAADLNGDGHLDLVASSYYDKSTGLSDMGNRIFWGSAAGHNPANAQWLPGTASIGLAVADLDADGYLDLFCPNYNAIATREHIPSYLYWGGPDGFSPQLRTIIVATSAHDAQVADFNRDGLLDLALSEHSSNNGHLIESNIVYNDGNRFSDPEKTPLPTIGTHFMGVQDMGNLYHRRFEESYTSEEFSWTRSSRKGELIVQARTPPGSSLETQVRSGANSGALEKASWRPVNENRFALARKDRLLQYRLLLRSQYGDLYPSVERVQVNIGP